MEAANPQLLTERETSMQKRWQMGMILLNIPMYTFLGEIISKSLRTEKLCNQGRLVKQAILILCI